MWSEIRLGKVNSLAEKSQPVKKSDHKIHKIEKGLGNPRELGKGSDLISLG